MMREDIVGFQISSPEIWLNVDELLLIPKFKAAPKVGRVSIDGTKVKANASKHHALSYGHATKLERRIKSEVQRLMRMAEKADGSERPDGLDIPAELIRREDRVKAIEEGKSRIHEREIQRIAAERAEYERRLESRRKREDQTGKKSGGRKPKPPSRAIDPKAQINLTDEESRIMPSADGMMQAYNAQAIVDCQSQLVLNAELSQRPTDCTLLAGAVAACQAPPKELGIVNELLADAGFCSRANVELCEAAGIRPYISFGREAHGGRLERFRKPKELADDASPVDRARHRLKTPQGRAIYGQRKATVEPCVRVSSVCAPREAIKDALLSRRRDFEDRATAASAIAVGRSAIGRAVQRAADVQQSCVRASTVRRICEAINDTLGSRSRDFENRPVGARTAFISRAVREELLFGSAATGGKPAIP